MAGEIDPRCRSTRSQCEKKPRTITALLFLLLLVLLAFSLLVYQPMEPAPTITFRHGRKERGCMQAVPRPQHVQGSRSNPRRRTSDLNEFNVPAAAASRGPHARSGPPSSSAVTSGGYNTMAHEVDSGPNPTRNKLHPDSITR